MAEEQKEPATEAAPAGPKKILGLPLPQFIFVLANVLIMLGGLGYVMQASLFYKKPAITEKQAREELKKEGHSPTEAVSSTVLIHGFPEMTINLRGQRGGRPHFASVEVSIQCPSETCLEQLKANSAKVEDAIQGAIAIRSYSELSSLEVKFRIKHEILAAVNTFLKDTAATDILFTQFVIQ